jgi:large subunit ribosomal protein L11
MAKEKVSVQIEGGKATAAPPLGPALGPLKINIGQVVAEINKKTQALAGMQVPVTVIVDTETKEFEITVGTPPVSALVKKETGIEKGASNPLTEKVADLKIEQIIKIALTKQDALLGKTLKEKCKEIMGTCQSMGIMVEGKAVPDAFKDFIAGKYDSKIASQKTELTAAELKELEAERIKLHAEIEAKRTEYESKAKSILASMESKTRAEKKAAMVQAGLPDAIIKQFLPADEPKTPGATGAAPAAGGKPMPGTPAKK